MTQALGTLLRDWRAARRISQLDLALEVGVSARHLSCVETGKARPSRDMVARLADAFGMPLRERNALLLAAGFAPHYPESSLAMPALAPVRRAIDSMLAQQEPYPAFVLNRHWDILGMNAAAQRLGRVFMQGRPNRHNNMVSQFFDPEDLRPAVVNWEAVAGDLIRHLHAEVAAMPPGGPAQALLDAVLAYPGVPARWRQRDLGAAPTPLLTTVFRVPGGELRFFSTITTFATPGDVTLDETRIESVFPEDEATAAYCGALAQAESDSTARAAHGPA